MNLVICGSRFFNDYESFEQIMLDFLSKNNLDVHSCIVISGGARGADKLAENFSYTHNYEFYEIPADWSTHGKSAGIIRNLQMLDVANHVVAFWDGKSPGTKHMIDTCKKRNIKNTVFMV